MRHLKFKGFVAVTSPDIAKQYVGVPFYIEDGDKQLTKATLAQETRANPTSFYLLHNIASLGDIRASANKNMQDLAASLGYAYSMYIGDYERIAHAFTIAVLDEAEEKCEEETENVNKWIVLCLLSGQVLHSCKTKLMAEKLAQQKASAEPSTLGIFALTARIESRHVLTVDVKEVL